jgi:hypothetical protein
MRLLQQASIAEVGEIPGPLPRLSGLLLPSGGEVSLPRLVHAGPRAYPWHPTPRASCPR